MYIPINQEYSFYIRMSVPCYDRYTKGHSLSGYIVCEWIYCHYCMCILVMGDRLNFIIDHRFESVDAVDVILPIIIGSHIFTELSTFYALEGNWWASGVFFIRPSSDGTYYGMVMSVRPGLRPSVTVFRTFLLHALTYWSEILCITLFLCM